MAPGLELTNVSKTFSAGLGRPPVKAVDEVSLTVDEGRVVAFVGPNGAGKTTTIYMLLGLLRPDIGTLRVLGGKPRALEVRRRIGYQSEIFHTYPFRTAHGALRFYGRLSGLSPETLEQRIDTLLERVGLTAARDRKVGSFSKGMVQRLGLAQALLHEPALLILDEPATGLDPEGRRMVNDIIAEQKARGATVFFSSHVLADVERACDHVVMINRGKIVYSQPMKRTEDDTEVWHIEVKGWNDEAAGRLPDADIAARTDGRVTLACPAAAKHALLRQLLDMPVDIGSVTLYRQTLEDIYMERIGVSPHG